jgi:hypothetical protein
VFFELTLRCGLPRIPVGLYVAMTSLLQILRSMPIRPFDCPLEGEHRVQFQLHSGRYQSAVDLVQKPMPVFVALPPSGTNEHDRTYIVVTKNLAPKVMNGGVERDGL